MRRSAFSAYRLSLKVQVYGYLVVVGKVFFTPDWFVVQEGPRRFKDWEKYAVPSLQVFRVCKQIKSEAEDVYFAEDLFVPPSAFDTVEPFSCLNECWSHPRGRGLSLFSHHGLQLIRNSSISFCNRGLVPLTISGTD
ncbi:hypothetical protein CC86DRAFT_120026 [Ophiobolus disseminans]|uniref:Uncharacterized protein n=1 Tax=Ophiobolus disseminans TaxID=1469910 RepID=A0A6A6ZHL5_9PLEO|nr:hypothetical protein CC86DRAFT_120026 [Ophiobolus disseminans]